MIGTIWNGDATITKGMGSRRGRGMFSVGGIVAFATSSYSSPDARERQGGCVPTQNSYILQEEIELKEWDSSTYPGDSGPVGGMDHQEILKLEDIFWHESYNSFKENIFILQILESNINIFSNGFIGGDIAEVRNHHGKFLHIYEIPERYHKCKTETFNETVKAINLQKKQEDDFEHEKVAKRYRGIELVFGITSSGWYASHASFGEHSVQLQHEHDITRCSHYGLKIMTCVPDGNYEFYIGEIPMLLSISGTEADIDTVTNTDWCNSQSWKYMEIQKMNFQKGWLFVNGEDVYEHTHRTVNEMQVEKRAALNEKFENLSNIVKEKYCEEIFKLTLRKKGSVLAILKVLSESSVQLELKELKKILGLTSSASIIANLIVCVGGRVEPQKAAKLSKKAFAWAYLIDALPGVSFGGYFDDAIEALEIYSKNWQGCIVDRFTPATNTLGDFFKKS